MINFLQQFSLSPRTSQPISLRRVLLRTSLVLLAMYLLVGGRIDGLTVYPLFRINVSLIVLGGLGWLLWRFWRRLPFPATPVDLPILAWLLVLLVTSLTSLDPRRSLDTFFYYLAFVLLFYFQVELQRTISNSLETWLSCLLIASVLTITFSYQIITVWYLEWLRIGGFEQPIPPANIRIDSLVGHANMLALYLNLLWPLVIGRMLIIRSAWMKVILGIWLVAALGMLFFTSSRGGWLSAAAAAGILMLLLAIDRRDVLPRLLHWLKAHRRLSLGMLFTGLVLAGLVGMLLLRQVQHPTHPTGNPRGFIWSVAWEMFRQQPLLGTGPGTYAGAFLQTYSIPPGWLLTHAHNFFLQMLSESGALGAGTSLWLGITVLWVAIRRWRVEPPGRRAELAGLLAALAGLGVHSQFDFPQVIPLINLIAATLLARLVAPLQLESRSRPAVGATLLATGWLATTVFFLWSWWGYAALQRGVQAAQAGDLVAAADWMERAIQRDPSLAIYHFQSGQTHALLAFDEQLQVHNQKELEAAIAAYERGLEIDETYALNWLSLGELRWANEDHSGSLAALEQAASLAPGSADLNLILGMKYEAYGLTDRAREQYFKSLTMQPSLAASTFFQGSTLRQEVLSQFTPPEPGAGWQALQAGEYVQAEAIFRSQLALNDAGAYLGLGQSLLGQGKWLEAEKALRTAGFIDPGDASVQEVLAQLYLSQGQNERAVATMNSSRDFRAWNDNEYGYSLSYHRFGLRNEFLLTRSCVFCFETVRFPASR